ncbi:MAG: TerB family tellurite resistance protein [Mastigocoleus sp. MO_167.B18]|uniref:tellurite resistance TerB family protein n=1 Tax=Mastigocoleus sp. MO_188.B34 TaxID=3036635 RepID=UPI002629810F|nr:TerB family tellurite resistance protein [Mastigocoleus sp. MO_188.B34]MDJ0696022.1 TerB family tellurite resistance protein [Mastigocoleus sp. MO_188.B34]MDJ0772072.1 TerB family tellurite resistance protein [Mastigocoleus sp. MO_167.B18]
MNKFQAAFEILYILSCIDGEVSRKEVQVINDFISSNYGNINFDTREIIDSFDFMTGEGILEELKLAANVFKEYSNTKDKLILFDFAYTLISADGRITEEEGYFFYLLGKLWNIDIDRYLKTKF